MPGMKLTEFYPERQGRPESKGTLDMGGRWPHIPPGFIKAGMLEGDYVETSDYDIFVDEQEEKHYFRDLLSKAMLSIMLGEDWTSVEDLEEIDWEEIACSELDLRVDDVPVDGAIRDPISSNWAYDVQNYMNFFGDRTKLSGGTISDGGSGTINISACEAWCKVTDDDDAVGKFFDYVGKLSQTLTDQQANFIYLDYNEGNPQVVVGTAPLTYALKLDHILLGVVFRDGTTVHIHNTDNIGISGIGRSNLHWTEHFAVHRVAGVVTSSIGTRNLAVTAGVVYAGLSRNATNAFNTETGGDTWTYWYTTDGSSTWAKVTPASTAIDNLQYNKIISPYGLATLSAAARYGVHWVYLDNDGTHLHVVYGQDNYTANGAEEAGIPSILPPLVTNYCVLIAKIIVQKSQDTLVISYPWTAAFATVLATDHGSLGGLSDVADHAYALLHNGTRALSGAWDMGSQNLTNVNIDGGTIDGVTITAPVLDGIVTNTGATLVLPAFTAGGDIIGQATYDLGSAASPFAEAYIGNTNDYLKVATVANIPTIYGVGAYTRFGDAAGTLFSAVIDSEDDVLITGNLQVYGISRIASSLGIDAPTYASLAFSESGTYRSSLEALYALDEMVLALSSSVGNQLVIGNWTYRRVDYDHAVQANPTLYVQSAINPDTANTQWVSITHDQSDGVIGCGLGNLKLPAIELTGTVTGGSQAVSGLGTVGCGALTTTGTTTLDTGLTGIIRADSGVLSVDATALLIANLENPPTDIATSAATSAWSYAHAANTTTAHGAVVAATASKIVLRDAEGQAKFAAPAEAGDALIKGTPITSGEYPAVTDENYLVGTGTSMEERAVPTSPTKEFFVPCVYGTTPSSQGYHPGYKIVAAAEYAYAEFFVPHDFNTIVEAAVVRIALSTATHRLNYITHYGAVGETYFLNSENTADVDTAETAWLIYEYDLSGDLTAPAAGDYVGVRVEGDATNAPDDLIIGVRFKYS